MNDSLEKSRLELVQSKGLTQISADWLTWIDRNISRNCTPQSIIETMVQRNYDKDYATKLVFERLANVASAEQVVSIHPGYEYEEIGIKLNGHVVQTNDREINVLLTVEKPR